MAALDAQRLVEEELQLEGDPNRNLATFFDHLDGAGGAAADRREQLPQLHRPRRVSDLGRDREALHSHARRPLQRPRRDHRRPLPGLLGGDHARRALAEVEVEGTPGKRRARASTSRTSSSAATSTWSGKSSAATSTSNSGWCRCRRASTRSAPTTSSLKIDENTIGVAAVLGTTFTGHADDVKGINDLLPGSKKDKGLDVPIHVDGASGGFVWPFLYPDSEWDFRLEQVRSINVSGHKFGLVYPGHRLADLPRRIRPRRAPRLLRELPRGERRDLHAELLHRRFDAPRPVLQLRPLRPRRLRLRDEGDGGERQGAGREARPLRPLRTDRRGRGAAAAGRLQAEGRARNTTSSTSPGRSRPSAAGCSPPTRCPRTRRR